LHHQKEYKQTKEMKSKIILALAGVIISAASFAASVSSLTITPASKESVFNVHYKSNQVGTVKVSILDSNNAVVYFEVLNNVGSFVRPYNFTELTEGEYTVVVEGNGVKQAEKVNYATAKVTSFAMVTGVENQKNKYLLNVTSKDNQNVTVRIYSNDGSLLHEQTIEVKENAAIIYDLNKVKSIDATVTFEISAGSAIQTIQI